MLKGNFEENNNRWIQAQLSMAYQTIPISQLGLRVKCVKQSSFFLFFSFSEININNKTKRPSNIWRVNKSTTQIYLLEELDSFLYNYSAWVEWVCFGPWLSIRSLEEFCVIPIQKRERGGGGSRWQRQGDPHSPLAFLVMKILSRMLMKTMEEGFILSFQIEDESSDSLMIFHLLFLIIQ